MLVQIQDKAALSTLPIINLRSYLSLHGWADEGPWGSRPATVYAKEHSGRNWEVLVPTRDTLADFAARIADSLAVLAAVEDRSQLDVFHDLKAVGADVIRVRPASDSPDDSLSLRRSATLYTDAYNLLASGARAAETPRAAYRGKMSSDVVEYLDAVQPWTGYQPSNVLTLYSPVPVGFGNQQDMGDSFVAPFSRRVTSKLAQALDHTTAAIEQVIVHDTLEPFEQAVDYGVSANLCDSVADLAKNGGGIAIDLSWAGVRPAIVADAHFKFSSNAADILTEAAKSFRYNAPSYDEFVVAQVVALARDINDFDGKATILSARDGRPVRMQVEFDRAVYDIVIEAFKHQASISLDGDVHLVGKGYELRSPRNLALL